MNMNADWGLLVGRVTLAMIFVIMGYMKLMGFAGTVAYAAAAGVPLPEIAIVVAVLVELVGGLMILVGYKAKWAALATAVFLIPVTYYFHSDFSQQLNVVMFLKNLSIFGGMILLAVAGAGKYSVDHMWSKKPAPMV